MKIPTEVCNQLSRLKKNNNNNNTNISKYRLMCGIQNVNVHQRTLKNCFKKCTYSPDQATIFKCWLLSRGVKPGGGGGVSEEPDGVWKRTEKKLKPTMNSNLCFFCNQQLVNLSSPLSSSLSSSSSSVTVYCA